MCALRRTMRISTRVSTRWLLFYVALCVLCVYMPAEAFLVPFPSKAATQGRVAATPQPVRGRALNMGFWDSFAKPATATPAAPKAAQPATKTPAPAPAKTGPAWGPKAGGASSPPPSTAGLKPVTITFVTLTKSKIVAKAFPGQSLREVAAEAKVTGIRYGCNSGNCATCTSLVNGVRTKVCRLKVPGDLKGQRMTVEVLERKLPAK